MGIVLMYVLYKHRTRYYKTYERALGEISFSQHIRLKTAERDDFPSVFRSYYNDGRICQEFYHNKGVIEGKYTYYDSDDKILCECNFVNGKLHGNCRVYNYNECNACNACGKENCELKKLVYIYRFKNGNRLNTDEYYMNNDLEYIIPYYLCR